MENQEKASLQRKLMMVMTVECLAFLSILTLGYSVGLYLAFIAIMPVCIVMQIRLSKALKKIHLAETSQAS